MVIFFWVLGQNVELHLDKDLDYINSLKTESSEPSLILPKAEFGVILYETLTTLIFVSFRNLKIPTATGMHALQNTVIP